MKIALSIFFYVAVLGLIIIFALYLFLHHSSRYSTIVMSTSSMFPSIKKGDVIVYDQKAYIKLNDVRRFDIIVCSMNLPKSKKEMLVVKRVIGLPGERLLFSKQGLKVKGEPLFFPKNLSFLNKEIGCYATHNEKEYIVPSDAFFVIGDNVLYSVDSRLLGCVTFKQIKGKVVVGD